MADRQYELVYILPPDTTEQQVTELHGQIEAVVSRMSGHIEKMENWGRKRLAYTVPPALRPLFDAATEIDSLTVMARQGQL